MNENEQNFKMLLILRDDKQKWFGSNKHLYLVIMKTANTVCQKIKNKMFYMLLTWFFSKSWVRFCYVRECR